MTAARLIEMLRQYPPDAIVRAYDSADWGRMPVTGIVSGPDPREDQFFIDLETDT